LSKGRGAHAVAAKDRIAIPEQRRHSAMLKPILLAVILITASPLWAQDVVGVEDCSKAQGADKKDGCLQSNVEYLHRLIRRNDAATQAKLREHETKLREHETKLREHETKLREHETKLREEAAKLAAATAKINAQRSEIDRLKSEVDQLEKTIAKK
jgi:peptidoglycan hydrolase CwlO-like protein